MWKKLSISILLLALFLSFTKRSGEEDGQSSSSSSSSSSSTTTSSCGSYGCRTSSSSSDIISSDEDLTYDYYRDTCPQAENIIRSSVQNLYLTQPDIAPALLRLVFHDCFIQGCDGSVLLNSSNGVKSEKDARPNMSLKGFDVVDSIKERIEDVCPDTVSCSDILVLAARDSVALVGGPYYILKTGRRDSLTSNFNESLNELPAPDDNLTMIEHLFAARDFDERETVALLGGHNVGTVHCHFLNDRLTNFSGSGGPDPSIEPSFLDVMMSQCSGTQEGPGEPGMNMSLQSGTGLEFGSHYYDSLMQGKGILRSDQELMTSEETASWVQTYYSDKALFQRDFAYAMMKLSNLKVLTKPAGQIRRICSSVLP